MPDTLKWTASESLVHGVRMRPFVPRSQGDGAATAAVYEPAADPVQGRLVLLQHGGSSSKTGPDVWDVALALAGRARLRVVALDGPVHGARLPTAQTDAPLVVRGRFFDIWEHRPAHVDEHVAAWRALIDELADVYQPARISWVGVSMGTAYGLPLLAVEPRINDAVIGMWGTSFVNSARLLGDAAATRARVLFQQKWDDELFTREGQLALFDALGTADKRLHVYPGGHVRLIPEQMDDLVRFLG